MKRILLLLAVFTAAAYGSRGDLRVIESNDRSLTLEFTPRFDTVQVIRSGNARFDLLTFAGASVDQSNAGMPDTRFLSVPLALPGREGTSVEIVSADYESITGFDQAPVPSLSAPTEEHPSGLVYAASVPSSGELYPQAAAAIGSLASVHGWTVGYLKLYPVQYQSSSRTLKKCTRMVVRVTYGPRSSQAAASGDGAWSQQLINYAAAQAWYPAAPSTARLAKKTLVNSVRQTGRWFKLEVTEDGMVKIDAAYLKAQGVDPASLSSIRDVKVYGGSGLPMNTDIRSIADIDVSQCAVFYYDANGNGKFDADDYALFYAHGAAGWTYDAASKQFSHQLNPFTASNYYLLQIASGGSVKEMQTLQSPSSAASVVTGSVGKVFFDEDKFNFNQSGQIWVGAPMSEKFLTRVVTNKLAGYAPGTEVTYKYDFFARSDAFSSFALEESGVLIGNAGIFGMSNRDLTDATMDYAHESRGEIRVVPALTDDRSTVRMTYTATSSNAAGYINWLEIIYKKQLVASSDELTFTSPDQGGSVEYPLSGFTTNAVMGFDVTDINNVKKIDLQLQQQMGTFRFRDNLTEGGVRSYWIGAASAYKAPKSTVKLPTSNLHGTAPGAEFVIITHRNFAPEAARLKAHKESLPGANALTTIVVDVDTLYNEFGNGTPDPTAIRNFVAYASERWQITPRYLLLFGDASFDYRGIAGSDKGWVPTYETVESNNKINSYCMDDYFGRIDTLSPELVVLGQGRIAVRTIEEARFAVDRIIRYESNAVQDQWKNTVTIVADDDWTPENTTETEHTVQAENLAQTYTPPSFEVKKIYIADYPTVITPQGRRKPDARQAIIDQVNRGTLLLNFTGHGNPTVWAHESILSLEDTKTQFFNNDRPTFVAAATCDWGRFDATDVQSSAEEMMKNQNGGAIGVLSATRAVYSIDNASLNYSFYGFALPATQFAAVPRLGDAFLLTKNDPSAGSLSNREKYHLLCDPTLRLSVPRGAMTVDSINGIATVTTQPDTLGALQKVTIKGTIRKSDLSIDPSVNGTALVTVYDAEREKTIPGFSAPYFTYVQPGAVLYKGENSIVNGKLEATFIVPKDISYDNKNGKISVYFASGATDGRGYTTNFMVGGTARNAANDTQGPSVSVYFDTPSFKSGDVVGEAPKLIVALSDSSGINSAGTGIGHRIEAWVDGSAKSIDLTDFYKSKRDSYQEGMVEYQMPKFEAGSHSILVKAWDVYNNPSTAEVSFTVAAGTGLSLLNVYNIPNPVSRQTTFTFQHNQLSPVDVQIKIYSVAGRLIGQIDRYAVADRFVQIPWDCRDNDGDTIGNGVYFYRIVAKTVDGQFSSEALGKLAVVK